MTNPISDIISQANKIANDHIAKVKSQIEGAGDGGHELRQDTKCAIDYRNWLNSGTNARVDTCSFISDHIIDDESVRILALIVTYGDEDGLTDEGEDRIAELMAEIGASNHLMTRWEQMLETQLVVGTPGNMLMVDATRATHYIRAMGFANPWSEEWDNE